MERAVARARVWKLAGRHAPGAGASAARPQVIDIDATLVNVHSDKEGAAPTFKKGYGLHPLTAWLPHAQALRSIAHDGGRDDVTVVWIGQTDGWFQRLPAGH
ncbi:Transposase DDE domain-containing protein [Actinomyces slackii]|uniref:Uncharacterized protein n=1 Tax=Actinomyces slackii TaxID=52774 RepID=A0A448KBL6_9ACTO|nr:Uncharacterised protein [Actinomyces slackii]